ncbi:MAG TPA: hypothetical protein DGG95_09555 [Cytophagales bacterium]|jgi:hypothetical protein|nr:hypothetical protein [Cytophagales bacterium]
MELLSVFKSENHRQYLTQLFPGCLALWPFALLIVGGINENINLKLVDSAIWTNIIIISVYVFFSMALGVLIEDIGSLFEMRLEEVYFSLKCQPRQETKLRDPLSIWSLLGSSIKHAIAWCVIFVPKFREWLLGCHLHERDVTLSSSDVEKNFYHIWDRYLLLSADGKEPVIIRYYRAVLVRFKFELNVSASLMLMLFGHIVLVLRDYGFNGLISTFKNVNTWIYLGGVYIIISILLIEAFKGIELLHGLRLKLTSENLSQTS